MVGRNILDHPQAVNWTIFAPSSKELDLMDLLAVKDFFLSKSPDLVIHCAGLVGGIQANIANPLAFLVNNISIGQNIIMSAHVSGVRNFLNLGSTCMYPRRAKNPLKEDAILTGELEPTNEGYALAKIVAERLCGYVRREDEGAHYKTIIPCNLYGRYDKFDSNTSHLIPAIIHKIHLAKLNSEKSVEIWGDGNARPGTGLCSGINNAPELGPEPTRPL